MSRRNISSGSQYEPLIGYSRAVVSGPWIFVSGTTGADPETQKMPESIQDQTENTLRKISHALHEAGGSMDDVVRVRYILPDKKEFQLVWSILRKWFANAPPAATMIEAGLIDDAMKIEIEVTALKNDEREIGTVSPPA